jgi:predicted nucleic acid-binding protein
LRRIYFDTSLLVAALIHEPGTAKAHRYLLAVQQHPWQISSWVVTELASALGINHRRGVISRGEVEDTWRRFGLLRHGRLQVLALESADFDVAARLCMASAPPLRAGDALHLALCQRHNSCLATLDRGLAEAATHVHVAVAIP